MIVFKSLHWKSFTLLIKNWHSLWLLLLLTQINESAGQTESIVKVGQVITMPTAAEATAFSNAGCNVTKSCWYHPPGCISSSSIKCLSGVEWTMKDDGLQVQLMSRVTDMDQTRPIYLAFGFSDNQRMNDDTVLECIQPPTGKGVTHVSYNDNTRNAVMWQATDVLLANGSKTSLVNGVLTCQMKFLIDNLGKVNIMDLFKLFNIESKPFYLIFARGHANPFTLIKEYHDMDDGPLFPWMTNVQVSFCRKNCTVSQFTIVDSSLQSIVPRYWRFRIAVMHGVAMMLAWWVLGSNGILIARYFKPVFTRSEFLGSPVWLHIHRVLLVLSVLLQLAAIFFIFWQANWAFYECSYECTSDNFSKKMHALCGCIATGLAVIQPVLAVCRPEPDSENRKFFNFLHWTIGMTAWGFASTTMMLALPLGKIGLVFFFKKEPIYIMGGYILFYFFINIVLEYMVSPKFPVKTGKLGPSESSEDDSNTCLRLFVLFIHFIISILVTAAITYMLVISLLKQSPERK